jgi:hypothetical protein
MPLDAALSGDRRRSALVAKFEVDERQKQRARISTTILCGRGSAKRGWLG